MIQPANSLDLNPIENLQWKILKSSLCECSIQQKRFIYSQSEKLEQFWLGILF